MEELGALGCPLRTPPPSLGTKEAFDWVADALLWLCARWGAPGRGLVGRRRAGACRRSPAGVPAGPLPPLCRTSPCCPAHPFRAAPELAVQRNCSSEAKRVAFLTALGTQFFAATRVRLNLRRLHRAGDGAVRELRRLAAALRQGTEAAQPVAAPPAAPQLDCEAGKLRALAQRVGASATKLVGALAAGPAAEASIAGAVAASTDVAAAQAALQAALAAAQAQAAQLEAAVAELGQEAAVLEGAVVGVPAAAACRGGG